MAPKNFDFDSTDSGEPVDPLPEAVEKHTTVKGLLMLKFGRVRGTAIYRELARIAQKAANEAGGVPGLIFNDDGGEFVSFHPNEGFDLNAD